MRIVVMFDLPTKSKKNKNDYIHFRNFLLRDGYDMMQFSIYTRLCHNLDAVDKHLKRIQSVAPKDGSVRVITVTNKQFADMKILVGKKDTQEKRLTNAQLLLF